MTREQLVKMVGEANVQRLEAVNCELSCRVGGNGIMHDDPYLEYVGCLEIDYDGLTDAQIKNLPVGGCYIEAVFRADNEIEQRAIDADCGLWDIADLPVDHYRISY